MLNNIYFSIPLWPGLSPEDVDQFVYPFLEECGSVVSDLYYTSRIAPFHTDAMGGIIVSDEVSVVSNNALVISERFGIPLSATFNNIHVDPRYANYKTFVKGFRTLYDAGVRVVTIPHTSWLLFGLKDEFPGLVVKNTILHRVNTAAEVAKLFEAGFDYINLERCLMRNEDALKEIHKAKCVMEVRLGRSLYLSLLYNEMCEGYCPLSNDHYTSNVYRTQTDGAYFHTEFADISPCKTNDENSPAYVLKAGGIPSYYSYLGHLSKYVNVFKMHGRESRAVFLNTLSIVTQFVRRELIDDPYRTVLSKLPTTDRRAYLTKIKNCKFDCWNCTLCDTLATRLK